MATKTDKGKGTDEEETAQTQREDSGETNESSRSSASAGSNSANAGNGSPRALQARPSQPTYSFDPQGAARAGLLNLASRWKESGALYQAIPAYMEILTTYPGTGAAAAATEGLVDLAHRLEDQGRFYTALSIFRKLELML